MSKESTVLTLYGSHSPLSRYLCCNLKNSSPGTGSSSCLTNALRMRRKRGTFAMQRQPFVPQINVRITEDQLIWLSSQVKPFRNKSAVIRDLIDSNIQRLDEVAKLATCSAGAGPQQGNLRPLTGNKPSLKQPEGVSDALQEQQLPPHQTEAVTSSAQELDHEKKHIVVKNEIKVEKARKPRAKKTKGTPEFEAFWKRYQGCRHRANGQSKPKAMQLWGQLVPDELQPDDLMRAIDGAIEDIRSRQGVGEFASPLPDCFRWLRDECYAVYLEDNTPAPTKSSMFL